MEAGPIGAVLLARLDHTSIFGEIKVAFRVQWELTSRLRANSDASHVLLASSKILWVNQAAKSVLLGDTKTVGANLTAFHVLLPHSRLSPVKAGVQDVLQGNIRSKAVKRVARVVNLGTISNTPVVKAAFTARLDYIRMNSVQQAAKRAFLANIPTLQAQHVHSARRDNSQVHHIQLAVLNADLVIMLPPMELQVALLVPRDFTLKLDLPHAVLATLGPLHRPILLQIAHRVRLDLLVHLSDCQAVPHVLLEKALRLLDCQGVLTALPVPTPMRRLPRAAPLVLRAMSRTLRD